MMLTPIDSHTIDALAVQWGALMLTLAWKGAVLLLLAVVLQVILRRGPAAARHFVWTCALGALLLLPLLGAALPTWEMQGARLPQFAFAAAPAPAEDPGAREVPTAYTIAPLYVADSATAPTPSLLFFAPSDTEGERATGASTQSAAPDGLARSLWNSARSWSAWTWALLAWELGVLAVCAWLSIGWWHLRQLQRRSRPLEDRQWLADARLVATELGMRRVPRLVRTSSAMTPLTWGVRRPVVLLPALADAWSPGQRIDVLRHEFAHVQRRDVLTQLLAQLSCALLWFHPLPWIAAAQMRLERERACDDRVLLAGSRASSYAGHLLEMARSLRSEPSLAASTIGMARRSQLGERMDSLLDVTPRARRFNRLARTGLSLLLIALLLPLATLHPRAGRAAVAEPDPPQVGDVPRTKPSAPRPPRYPRSPFTVFAPRAHRSHAFASSALWNRSQDEHANSYELDAANSNFSLRSDGTALEVENDGRVRFAENESDVEWMEEGAYFELERKEGRDRRRMVIEADRDGELERRYSVGGRQAELDDEARAWFASALSEFMMHAGIATVPRLKRWVDELGVDGAMERISAMGNGHARARHWSALLGLEQLESEDRAAVLRALPRGIDSNFEKVEALTAFPRAALADANVRRAFLETTRGVDSDFERARALVQTLPLALDDEAARQAMWRSISEMDSDFEKARVIASLVDKIGHDEAMLLEALDTTGTIDSDFEKSRLLRNFATAAARFPSTREKYLELAESLNGDHEYGQVMRALRRAER